jgi:HPt (histidine-containing phosphotransfer) domain-containing protein
MDDFLSKPVRAADLWAAIDRVVAPRPTAERLGPGVLDPAVLWEVCGGDAGMLERICPAFLVRMPDHPAAVQDALQQQDSSRLRESAHKPSGLLAAFSIVASGVTSDLEDHAARGRLDEAGSLVERLETMAEDLIRLAGGLSLATLRQQIEAVDPKRTASH